MVNCCLCRSYKASVMCEPVRQGRQLNTLMDDFSMEEQPSTASRCAGCGTNSSARAAPAAAQAPLR